MSDMSTPIDIGMMAQSLAETHINECEQALWADPGEELESPASAPYDGCMTCTVREILFAVWVVVDAYIEQELEKQASGPAT